MHKIYNNRLNNLKFRVQTLKLLNKIQTKFINKNNKNNYFKNNNNFNKLLQDSNHLKIKIFNH